MINLFRFFIVGTFFAFNTANPLAIEDKAAVYGNHIDRTLGYVGKADQNICFNGLYSPARIDVSPSKPGAYYTCTDAGSYYNYVTTGLLALYDTPDLFWAKRNSSLMPIAAKQIEMNSGAGYTFAIGRYRIGNYTMFGKVIFNSIYVLKV